MAGHLQQLISPVPANLLLGNVFLPPLIQRLEGLRSSDFLCVPVAGLL